ncbi:hypothetical protein AHAT_19100 [Agarivorans sp. Toyoura001]|uniref:hypothetical protein n=1 Tax=Agarivorans sp. Toyoura001 TaxID=2283141 RepID=UPI0010F1FCA8|nr:hypothetical protein [Agarivorans sp. Toyoura001]GDY26020.1 hypothetical protein AHAT_19100 [Agarivorans sp. Toyoura001]
MMNTERLNALIAKKEVVKKQLESELGELKPVLAKIAANPMSALSLLSGGAETLAPAAKNAMAMLETLDDITHEMGELIADLDERVTVLEQKYEVAA